MKSLSSDLRGLSVGTSYRPDIDGLRAVAVLSVVLYHINKSLVPGGFVGVDIFFVISGFLITGNIWSEISRGGFSLADFYVRRIRRIYPAFAVVTVATLLAGCLLLLPDDLVRLGRSAFWSAISLPNVYFWNYLDTSYFAAAAEQEPLLHMWSLGVEEQFYFIWPVALIALAVVAKRRKSLIIALALVVSAASFAYAETFLSIAPKFTYYMLPARAGELLVGASAALLMQGRRTPDGSLSRWVTEICSLGGLGLIGYSLFFLNDSSDFPGVNSIWPCLGSVLVIVAGQRGAMLSRTVLSVRPVVLVGLISYSLYLWHWPVLAFYRYFYGEIGFVAGCASVVFMFLAAWLSYKYVEAPFRSWRPAKWVTVVFVWLVPLAAIVAIALALISTNGLKRFVESSDGYKARVAGMASAVAPAYKYGYVCQLSVSEPGIMSDPRCVIGAKSKLEPDVLLWGDSKAAQYVGFYDDLGKSSGISIRNAEHSSCPPVFADDFGGSANVSRPSCNSFWRVVKSGVESKRYRVVIISGNWKAYEKLDGFREALDTTLQSIWLTGATVVFVSDVPRYKGYNRECLQRSVRLPWKLDCAAGEEGLSSELSQMELHLASIAEQNPSGASFMDIKGLLCTQSGCHAWHKGVPLYFDEGHLSLEGGRLLGQELLSTERRQEWIYPLQN